METGRNKSDPLDSVRLMLLDFLVDSMNELNPEKGSSVTLRHGMDFIKKWADKRFGFDEE